MSEPQVPQPKGDDNVDDVVDSAKAALADAEAAADGTATPDANVTSAKSVRSEAIVVDSAGNAEPAVETDAQSEEIVAPKTDSVAGTDADADAAAFAEAEREFPGTFGGTFTPQPQAAEVSETVVEETVVVETTEPEREPAPAAQSHRTDDRTDDRTETLAAAPVADRSVNASVDDAPTAIVASEPTYVAQAAPQPIFVQAPEAPRERGNRGTAGAIGLLAALSFAVLYLGAALGFGALAGDVTGENILAVVIEQVTSVGFWVTVVVFYLSFWILGAIINRGRWGYWVIFGLFVGLASYAGHLLGVLIEAPFWSLTAEAGATLVSSQLLAPMAIVALVVARELTIWFGAWVARSGARKTVLNAEAQREYERTLEAGPQLTY